jgi:hypothetical protein
MGESAQARMRRLMRSREYSGSTHRIARKNFSRLVASGKATCADCGAPIDPNEPWDLAHVRGDRSRYAGPSHRACNRNTAGRAPLRQSRVW